MMHEQGRGFPQDYEKAVALYREAAEAGYALAKYDLAYMYENGKGVAVDKKRAVTLYEESAPEVATARHNLSLIYLRGDGVPQDVVKAYMWTLLAINKGMERLANGDSGDFLHGEEQVKVRIWRDFNPSKDQIKEAKKMALEWLERVRPSDARFGGSLRDDLD